MLLDESTAAIDPETEQAFHHAFRRLAKGKTVLVIAHRLRTIQGADRIIVLDKGRVVQTGTHSDLVGQPGLYASLWHAAPSPTASPRADERW